MKNIGVERSGKMHIIYLDCQKIGEVEKVGLEWLVDFRIYKRLKWITRGNCYDIHRDKKDERHYIKLLVNRIIYTDQTNLIAQPGNKKRRNKMNRNNLENRLSELNLGDFDTENLSDEELENLVEELEAEEINLETDAGNTKLEQIASKYIK